MQTKYLSNGERDLGAPGYAPPPQQNALQAFAKFLDPRLKDVVKRRVVVQQVHLLKADLEIPVRPNEMVPVTSRQVPLLVLS
jgi:hypothetical protein